MKKYERYLPIVVAVVAVVVLYADPSFAQNFNAQNTGQTATFNTGLGSGVDRVLGTVVNAARVIGIAGGLIQGVKAGYEYSKGQRDAMDLVKGVAIGLVIMAAGVGIAQALVTAAGT